MISQVVALVAIETTELSTEEQVKEAIKKSLEQTFPESPVKVILTGFAREDDR